MYTPVSYTHLDVYKRQGVTEPLEFMFMFCALPLYLVYAVLQGLSLIHISLQRLQEKPLDMIIL